MRKRTARRSNLPNPGIPQRGEIWSVNFNDPPSAPTPPDGTPRQRLPTTGDEIYKPRPAVVLNIPTKWMRRLHIVVPLTKWKTHYKINQYFWMIEIPRDKRNKLSHDSAADTRQVKSVSIERFGRNVIGVVSKSQLDSIVETVAFFIGYSLPR